MISRLRRIPLHLLILFVLGLLWPRMASAQQPSLDIVDIDFSSYPAITVKLQSGGLGTADVQRIQILEDGRPQSVTVTPSSRVRIGILFDGYRGLDADTVQRVADAVDRLDTEPWQWEERELALFVPDADGTSIATQVDWMAGGWRSITNGILGYYTGIGELRPVAAETALRDLTYAALLEFEREEGTHNFLIVFTNGFDRLSQRPLEQLTAVRQQNAVSTYFVDYDLNFSAVGPSVQLASLATSLEAEVTGDAGSNLGLASIWQAVAETPLSATGSYTTQTKPPFALTAETADEAIASAPIVVNADIPAVEVQIIRPTINDTISTTSTVAAAQLSWSPLYPARRLGQISYAVAGQRQETISPSIDASGLFTIAVGGLVDGTNILDLVVREEIDGFVARAQTPLYVSLPAAPFPTVIPAVVAPPPAAGVRPVPTWTQTSLRWMNGRLSWLDQRVPIPLFRLPVPEVYSVNVLAVVAVVASLGLAVVSVLLALAAMRRSSRIMPAAPFVRTTTQPGRKTTDSWTRVVSAPKAELVLIQGEGMLPNVILLRDTKTYFGRDFVQVDELLANRYVSQKQFLIWEQNGRFFLGNCSVVNRTMVNDREAPPEALDFPSDGPFLESGSVIQFGPFKYRFMISYGGPGLDGDGDGAGPSRRRNPLLRRTAGA